jgi:hypothetical protein
VWVYKYELLIIGGHFSDGKYFTAPVRTGVINGVVKG